MDYHQVEKKNQQMQKQNLITRFAVLAAALALVFGADSVWAKSSKSSKTIKVSKVDKRAKVSAAAGESTPREVPDGGATALLVGLGLGAVALAGRKK